MTEQETFDYVVGKIIQQGRPSVAGGGFCMYRGSNGLKCAAGWLIPDEAYDPSFEGSSASKLHKSEHYIFEHLGLVLGLQRAHDSASGRMPFISSFEAHAKFVAEEFDLEWRFD